MSITDELCRLLDERGAKYVPEIVTEGTLFVVTKDVRTYYILAREKGFEVWSEWLTPAQAIAATLGAGTCHYEIAFFGDGKAWFACSECGGMASADYDPPKYCPHCGRKVVDE